MATSDYNIADQTGTQFLADMNDNILTAIKSNNSDTATSDDPTNITFAVYNVNGFLWFDTTNTQLKIRTGVDETVNPTTGGSWTAIQIGAVNTTNIENSSIGDLNGFHIQFNGDGIDFFNDTTHITRINASGIFTSGNVTASDSTPG